MPTRIVVALQHGTNLVELFDVIEMLVLSSTILRETHIKRGRTVGTGAIAAVRRSRSKCQTAVLENSNGKPSV